MHGFDVPLVEGIAAHRGPNRDVTRGAGNLQGGQNLKYARHQQSSHYHLLQVTLISI